MSNSIKRLLDRQRKIFHDKLERVSINVPGLDPDDFILDVMIDLPYPKFDHIVVANEEELEKDKSKEEKLAETIKDSGTKIILEQGNRITIVAVPDEEIPYADFMTMVETFLVASPYSQHEIESYVIEWAADIKSRNEN